MPSKVEEPELLEEQPAEITAEVYDHGDSSDDRKSKKDRETHLAISRANRTGLVANMILMLGYIFTLWFQVYEFTARDRETIAIVVYFLGFALLILSGLIELSVDVFSIRTIGHGRYHSDSALWNRIISTLFISAGILDIVAFVYWMRRELEIENTVLTVSSYILLIMAILALYFQMVNDYLMPSSSSWAETIIADKIDLMANVLVFATTIVGVVLRHMEGSDRDFGDSTNQMELAMMPLFLFSSILYVINDIMRLKQGILDEEK